MFAKMVYKPNPDMTQLVADIKSVLTGSFISVAELNATVWDVDASEFTAGGTPGMMADDPVADKWTAYDTRRATAFTLAYVGPSTNWYDVQSFKGRFIAACGNTSSANYLYTSGDGVNWSGISSANSYSSHLTRLMFNTTAAFAIAGPNGIGTSSAPSYPCMRTLDGINWTEVSTTADGVATRAIGRSRAGVWNGSKFFTFNTQGATVVDGEAMGGIYYSAGGTAYTKIPIGDLSTLTQFAYITEVASNSTGQMVAFTSNGYLISNTGGDGTQAAHWTQSPIVTGFATMNGIASDGTNFLVTSYAQTRAVLQVTPALGTTILSTSLPLSGGVNPYTGRPIYSLGDMAFIVNSSSGILKSTDLGATWTNVAPHLAIGLASNYTVAFSRFQGVMDVPQSMGSVVYGRGGYNTNQQLAIATDPSLYNITVSRSAYAVGSKTHSDKWVNIDFTTPGNIVLTAAEDIGVGRVYTNNTTMNSATYLKIDTSAGGVIYISRAKGYLFMQTYTLSTGGWGNTNGGFVGVADHAMNDDWLAGYPTFGLVSSADRTLTVPRHKSASAGDTLNAAYTFNNLANMAKLALKSDGTVTRIAQPVLANYTAGTYHIMGGDIYGMLRLSDSYGSNGDEAVIAGKRYMVGSYSTYRFGIPKW